MAKFIKLNDIRRNGEVVLNVDTIEYMVPMTNGNTEIVSTTHHTKYIVSESMDYILDLLERNNLVVSDPNKNLDELINGDK